MVASVRPEAESGSAADRLDLAARAAWLYYIAGNTQDEIAAKLGLSRAAAQRLVALAVSEKLVRFRIDHPVISCVELAERLRDRYGLDLCDVVPSDPTRPGRVDGLAVAGAAIFERFLSDRVPTIVTVGSGRTLRATIREISPMRQPQHKIVSVVGNLTRDGRANPYDVVIRLADKVEAQCYPLPIPLIAETPDQRDVLRQQHLARIVMGLAEQARAAFFGIGPIGWQAPLHVDGFLTEAEIADLMTRGAIGELGGYAFDEQGRMVEGGTNRLVTTMPFTTPPPNLRIGIGGGAEKAAAIRGALRGRLLSGLVTDEDAARLVLQA